MASGPPQVLCVSCRASSSLDSLIGLGAFASGGIALKVPQAQAAPPDPARSPGAERPPARPAPGGTASGPARDLVIDLTDDAVTRAARAAAVLEDGEAAPPSGRGDEDPVPPAGASADAVDGGSSETPDGAISEGAGSTGPDPSTTPSDTPAPAVDADAADDDGSGSHRSAAGRPADPAVTDSSDAEAEAAPPPRPERIPSIRDLTRGTSRPRSTLRRAEPLAPAPRQRPAPTETGPPQAPVAPGTKSSTVGPPPVGEGPTPLDAGVWKGRGRRRPSIIDLRDETSAPPVPTTTVGPQWSGAQERGAVRALLDGLTDGSIDVLHDRRAPGCLSAVDHLVVAPSGVWVVDSMGFSGKVGARRGGRLRNQTSLRVGGRDRTPLLTDISQRVHAVRTALADSPAGRVPFRAALCFSDDDLGRDGEPFDLDGVLVTSRRHLLAALTEETVIDDAHRAVLLHTLAERLPPIG